MDLLVDSEWQDRLEWVYQSALDTYLQPDASEEVSAATWFIRKVKEVFDSSASLEGTPLILFAGIESLIEFSVKDRLFKSRVLVHSDHVAFQRSVELLKDVYLSPEQQLVEQIASARLSARTAREKVDNHTQPGEVLELMVPLARHLYQVHIQNPECSTLPVEHEYEMDGFNRSLLRNWRRLLESGGVRVLNHSEIGAQEDVPKSSVLNCYPYFSFHEIDREYMLMVAVNTLNEAELDEKVLPEFRIPTITLAVVRQAELYEQKKNLPQLASYLNQLFDRLETTVIAYRFQLALEASSGEASAISRYWYSTGVVNLLGTGVDQAALEDEDVLDFWDRFVTEVLCARIPGVNRTEVYPFDRVYIMDWTGANEDTKASTIRVRVLETAIRSRDPRDLNQHLSSLKRGDRELKDFDVVDKIIKYRTNFELTKPSDLGDEFELKPLNQQGFDDVDLSGLKYRFEVTPPGKDELPQERLFKMVIQMLRLGNFKPDGSTTDAFDDERAKIWGFFQNMGIAYQYRHGLNLEREAPALHAMQRAYFEMLESFILSDSNTSGNGAKEASRRRLGKVVYIAYDPSLHTETTDKALGSDSEGNRLIPRNARFSMALVADDDPEKSAAELDAEKKDLRLLIELIIRQQLRDKKREKQALRKRMGILKQTLDQFMHRLRGEDIPPAVKERVENLWRGLSPLLETEKRKLDRVVIDPTSGGVIESLFQEIIEKDYSGLDLLGMLNRMRDVNCGPYIEKGYCDRGPTVTYLPSIIPGMTLRVPLGLVRESFEVMYKNACEAACTKNAPSTRNVTVQVQARPDHADSSGRNWFVDLIVENTTAPIPAATLARLNADTPVTIGENKDKLISTGIGVATSRSQLKDGVGKGADIRYVLIARDRLQARMTLPAILNQVKEQAHQVEPEIGSVVDAREEESGIPETDYVLYVEDTEDIAKKNIDYLRARFASCGLGLKWTRSFEKASEALKANIPRLVITDLDILQKDIDSQSDPKWGRHLLDSIFKLADPTGARPPVWIVSGKEVEECRGFICGCRSFKQSGYEMVEVGSNTDLLKVGQVSLLKSVKLLQDCEAATSALDGLAVENDGIPVKLIDTFPTEAGIEYLSASLGKKDFDKKLAAYFDSNKSRDVFNRIFVAKAAAANQKDLSDVLVSWFSHPGMPDLEIPDEPPRQLSDTTTHKTVVLSLVLDSALAGEMPLNFSHWCLCRNIVLHSGSLTDQNVADLWFGHIKDRKGIFSVIRHDLNSSASRFPKLADSAMKLRELVNRTEACLVADINDEQIMHSPVPREELSNQIDAVKTFQPGDRSVTFKEIAEAGFMLKQFTRDLPVDEKIRYQRLERGLSVLTNLMGGLGGKL